MTPLRLLDWYSGFGDNVTSIWTFRYRGKTYFAEDFGDAGSLGDRKFSIFKWNYEKIRYDTIFSLRCNSNLNNQLFLDRDNIVSVFFYSILSQNEQKTAGIQNESRLAITLLTCALYTLESVPL